MTKPQTSLVRSLLQGISLLFHPLAAAVWMAVLVMSGLASPLSYPLPVRLYVIGMVVFMTLGVPLLFGWLLRTFGVKGNVNVRHTSLLMVLMMVVCYITCGWVFEDIVVLFLMRKMLYSFATVAVVMAIFEFFYPLSHHTTMFGALMGMLWMLLIVGNVALLIPFIIGIVVAGILTTSRLMLTECRVGSAVWGVLMGFGLSALMLVVI